MLVVDNEYTYLNAYFSKYLSLILGFAHLNLKLNQLGVGNCLISPSINPKIFINLLSPSRLFPVFVIKPSKVFFFFSMSSSSKSLGYPFSCHPYRGDNRISRGCPSLPRHVLHKIPLNYIFTQPWHVMKNTKNSFRPKDRGLG